MTPLQITHTLSVSLNKIGDLKYYAGDVEAARSYYFRALNVRREAIKHYPNVSSQVGNLLFLVFYFAVDFIQDTLSRNVILMPCVMNSGSNNMVAMHIA